VKPSDNCLFTECSHVAIKSILGAFVWVSYIVTTVELDRICKAFQFICSVPRPVILFRLHFS